jgi:hypothetical protein
MAGRCQPRILPGTGAPWVVDSARNWGSPMTSPRCRWLGAPLPRSILWGPYPRGRLRTEGFAAKRPVARIGGGDSAPAIPATWRRSASGAPVRPGAATSRCGALQARRRNRATAAACSASAPVAQRWATRRWRRSTRAARCSAVAMLVADSGETPSKLRANGARTAEWVTERVTEPADGASPAEKRADGKRRKLRQSRYLRGVAASLVCFCFKYASQ